MSVPVVSDLSSNIIDLLRAAFAEEAAAGFPRLQRVPQTKAIQLLDYFASLGAADQAGLLDALALRGAIQFLPGHGGSMPSAPAFDRYWAAITSQGPFVGGYRYCDVKFLSMVPKVEEFGGYEGWINNYQKPWVSERALQPRKDLLPDLDCLKPAKAPLLRKLLTAAFGQLGFTSERRAGGEQKYVGPSGVAVAVDFGSYLGQVCYGVSITCGQIKVVRVSYESLWSQPGGWDYLTEENAQRSIELLPELVEYLTGLTERVNGLTKRLT